MEYKCPGCNGPLSFQEATQTMYCFYCDSHYSPSQFENHKIGASGIISGETKSHMRAREYIKMQTVVCNSCGAKLAVNDVEASSYCAYCGQPSVVIGRVEDYLKPDYIIPFKITEEEAEECIQKRLKKNHILSGQLKDLDYEMCRGIYIPYWLFDIYFEDFQKWHIKLGKISYFEVIYGNGSFEHFPVDASDKLSDDLSQRIDPYDMEELIPFDAAYLSGFYSDRFDTPAEKAAEKAYDRLEYMLEKKIQKSLTGKKSRLWGNSPKGKIIKEEYALLPVWFFTYRSKEKVYTAIVNGQTGKVAGNFPPSKKRVAAIFTCLFLPLCFAIKNVTSGVFWNDRWIIPSFVIGLIIGILFWLIGWVLLDLNLALREVSQQHMGELVNNRQKKEE